MDPVGTHQPILTEAIRRSSGPILELGSGDYSTWLIHELAGERRILTIDDNPEWLNKYTGLKNDLHEFRLISNEDILDFYLSDDTHWSVVLVDNITWDIRLPAIKKYKHTSDYLVIHDAQYPASIGKLGKVIVPPTDTDPGIRDFGKSFRYWIEFVPDKWINTHPTTLLASNRINLQDFEVRGMRILSRNK